MKDDKIKKLLDKKIVNIKGYMYRIVLETPGVALVPFGNGNLAVSWLPRSGYLYIHGGDIYKLAVDVAYEIHAYLVRQLSRKSDV